MKKRISFCNELPSKKNKMMENSLELCIWNVRQLFDHSALAYTLSWSYVATRSELSLTEEKVYD